MRSFVPARMTAGQLEAGYREAYREFYGWPAIVRSAWTEEAASARLRHLAYTAGWKKAEPLWDLAIRHGRVQRLLPLLETLLAGPAVRRGAGDRERAGDRGGACKVQATPRWSARDAFRVVAPNRRTA